MNNIPPDAFELVVYYPNQPEPDTFDVSRFPLVIGRGTASSVRISHPSISKLHARIQHNSDGTFTIEDLDSLNGVTINNKKVPTSPLEIGTELILGDVNIKFRKARQGGLGDPFSKFKNKFAEKQTSAGGDAQDEMEEEILKTQCAKKKPKIALRPKGPIAQEPENKEEMHPPVSEPEAEAEPIPDADKWQYKLNDKTIGPFKTEKLAQMAEAGIIQPDTMVAPAGTEQWIKAERLPNLHLDKENKDGLSAIKKPKAPMPVVPAKSGGGKTLLKIFAGTAILVVVAGILFYVQKKIVGPKLRLAKEEKMASANKSDLKKLATSLETYVQENNGLLPYRIGALYPYHSGAHADVFLAEGSKKTLPTKASETNKESDYFYLGAGRHVSTIESKELLIVSTFTHNLGKGDIKLALKGDLSVTELSPEDVAIYLADFVPPEELDMPPEEKILKNIVVPEITVDIDAEEFGIEPGMGEETKGEQ